MRIVTSTDNVYQKPPLLNQAESLANYVQSLPAAQLENCMHLSAKKARQVHEVWQHWSTKEECQLPAIDAFLGDIYSGLQVQTFSQTDRTYANSHLYILSGLYGVLRALDSIAPYRLEMGYKLPNQPYANLYQFWADQIASVIVPAIIINLSAVEYTKSLLPYVNGTAVITPKFMTMNQAGIPTQVTVHTKVARGAFANWLIRQRIQDVTELPSFNQLNYKYDATQSTPERPAFVCQKFGGIGLSVRLT